MVDLYKGIFNWVGESYTMYTHAISLDKAFLNFINQLNKKIKYTGKSTIIQYFDGTKDNYYITKEKEKKDGKKLLVD